MQKKHSMTEMIAILFVLAIIVSFKLSVFSFQF